MDRLLDSCRDGRCLLIGMLHLPPLPGAPRYGGDIGAILHSALRDAEALAAGGADGLLLENFGDAPFYPRRAPAATVAHMTAVACAVKSRFDIPLGVNLLRNDGPSALAIAHAAGADFIRVNVLCGARVTDQGLIEGIAHELLRDRAALGANVKIFADVDVKHSAPLAPRPLAAEAAELIERGGADALIVSGAATGSACDAEQLQTVKRAAGAAPVFVGSGVTAANVANYLPYADGFIVGSSLKADNDIAAPIDRQRVEQLVTQIRGNSP